MSKDKNTVAYSPTESDYRHMYHCVKLGLVRLALSRESETSNLYHLVRIDNSKPLLITHYFLKDFKKPPTPSNRQTFTEVACYEKMFSIYKEMYMRDNNITETVIAEVIKKDAEPVVKIETKKSPKKKPEPKDMLNFPFKQVTLMELIDICEKEQKDEGI